MYNLYKIDESTYQIHSAYSNEKAMEGNLFSICKYCIRTLGFELKELEFALQQMLESDCDAAHFGINRTFIFAFNRKDRKVG
jgi:hypothetical protein